MNMIGVRGEGGSAGLDRTYPVPPIFVANVGVTDIAGVKLIAEFDLAG